MSSDKESSHFSLDDDQDLIAIGRITRTQGNRGGVRLFPFFEPLDRFEGLRSNEIFARPEPKGGVDVPPDATFRPLHISSYFFHQNCVILGFEEIPDMNAAECLRGTVVYVHRTDLWPLSEGEFFAHELEGFRVLDDDSGTEMGVVESVEPGGAHDFLRVRRADRTFLIPFVHELVKHVDPTAHEMRVSLPPGIDEL